MDRMAKVKINTCSRWELLRLPGVGNKIADKICKMREEGAQFTRDNLVNIPYVANFPELFEMIATCYRCLFLPLPFYPL
jgi:predicted DNA-binding helix-hairpin-helix protein